MKKTSLVMAFALALAMQGSGQQNSRCSAVEYLRNLEALDPDLRERRQQQEPLIMSWIDEHASDQNRSVITIPVVFHIIYNDSSQNISDAIIQSQLDVINEDYRRQNADSSQTPLAFRPLAADCEIQFCLAKRTPAGQSTTGIVRKFTNVTSFSNYDDPKFNSTGGNDAWDTEKYMNVWIANFSNQNFLGIGTFPNSVPPLYDGIVVNYKACGRIGNHLMDHYNKGRSLTHEVGHWLNLLHIWGDDGFWCSSDDHVSDTPLQTGENYSCPSYPRYDSCTTGFPGIMFMNFMDYTDDECMNIFTEGQKQRMLAALNLNRPGIVTSNGCMSVGIEENNITQLISVFPNPASELMTIKSDGVKLRSYEFRNLLGETILSSAVTTEKMVDISALASGIYILRINADSGTAVIKVIKR